jgi:hypothetical protein
MTRAMTKSGQPLQFPRPRSQRSARRYCRSHRSASRAKSSACCCRHPHIFSLHQSCPINSRSRSKSDRLGRVHSLTAPGKHSSQSRVSVLGRQHSLTQPLNLPNTPHWIAVDIILMSEVAAVAWQQDCGVGRDASKSRHPAPYSPEMLSDNSLEQLVAILWGCPPNFIRCWNNA